MKFGTCHDSGTVVTWAKFHCDRLNTLWTRALQILIEFQIQSKYHLQDRHQVYKQQSKKKNKLYSLQFIEQQNDNI